MRLLEATRTLDSRISSSDEAQETARGLVAVAALCVWGAAQRCLGANPILRNFYLRLRAAGKPAKVVLTATMRKLLIVLNSALKPDKLCLKLRLTAGDGKASI
jgi:transposase